jgi:hypothetical protein
LNVRNRAKLHEQDDEEVEVESVPRVTFAVRCIPELEAGSIRTSAVIDRSLDPRRPLKIALGRQQYEVRLQAARKDLFDARVILTDGRRTQVLYEADGFADEPHFDVVWAGDLDRDGRLDLVVNLSRKYSVHPYRLLLSSKASKTQLVGEAAVFETGN